MAATRKVSADCRQRPLSRNNRKWRGVGFQDCLGVPAMRVALISLLLVLPLAACVTQQERQARAQATINKQQAELAAVDSADCAKYGFQPGSKGFAACMMTLDQNRKQLR